MLRPLPLSSKIERGPTVSRRPSHVHLYFRQLTSKSWEIIVDDLSNEPKVYAFVVMDDPIA